MNTKDALIISNGSQSEAFNYMVELNKAAAVPELNPKFYLTHYQSNFGLITWNAAILTPSLSLLFP